MANPNAQFPAQNIVTDQGVYPFSALLEVIKRLIAALFGAGASTVLWRPGGVSSGNVFATWAEVVAAVAKLNGEITIGVDVELAPAVIPVGAWDLRPPGVSGGVEFVNATKLSTNAFAIPFVTIDNAAVSIHGLTGFRDIQLENRSTVDVITTGPTNMVNFYIRGFGALYQSVLAGAGVSFIHALGAAGGGDLRLYQSDFTYIGTIDGGTNAIRISSVLGNEQISIQDEALFDANQLVAVNNVLVMVPARQMNFVGLKSYQSQAGAPTISPHGLVLYGSAAIVVGTGKTAAIPAFVDAGTVITVSLKTPVGDALTVKYAALAADRVNGNPGSFQISALAAAGGGAVNGADTSTIDYEIFTS